mmetsp:Transcript_25536/g.59157  ORF Transcript_25536/g.59157 Transcript_25536/m.59157 type:complete len:202 (+) Transcript_25536:1234-1839(+)
MSSGSKISHSTASSSSALTSRTSDCNNCLSSACSKPRSSSTPRRVCLSPEARVQTPTPTTWGASRCSPARPLASSACSTRSASHRRRLTQSSSDRLTRSTDTLPSSNQRAREARAMTRNSSSGITQGKSSILERVSCKRIRTRSIRTAQRRWLSRPNPSSGQSSNSGLLATMRPNILAANTPGAAGLAAAAVKVGSAVEKG